MANEIGQLKEPLKADEIEALRRVFPQVTHTQRLIATIDAVQKRLDAAELVVNALVEYPVGNAIGAHNLYRSQYPRKISILRGNADD